MPKRGSKSVRGGGNGKKNAKGQKQDVPQYVSDEEDLYGNQPDPESREYMFDAVDDFHAKREKILLEQGYKPEDDAQQSDEEEVLELESEESDDEEIRNLKAQLRHVKRLQKKDELGSDVDDNEEDDEEGLPDSRAWGSKRSKFYGDDDIDMDNLDEEDAEALLEEKEALKLQRQMTEQLDEQDFGLDIFQPSKKLKELTVKEEKIVKDLSQLSRREKLKLLKKESPELLKLIEDFQEKITELIERLCPLKRIIEMENLQGKAANYIHTKLKLNLSYCTNILFYLMLKAKQVSVYNHPVLKRLLQYKNIMKQLVPLDNEIKDEIDNILLKLKKGVRLQFEEKTGIPKTLVRTRVVQEKDTGESEEESLDQEGIEENIRETEEGNLGAMEEEKRAITYQIAKNKGLTPHKRKELRNPRVKHRMKFKKAKISRKGQFREPRAELQKYSGEISGIRAGIKRGVKLK